MSFVVERQYTATKLQLHQMLTMTKQGKLRIKRLRIPPPKDQEQTRTLPRCLGGRLPFHGGRQFSRPLRFGQSPDLVFLHLPFASPTLDRCQAPQKQRHLAANQPNDLRSL